MAVITSSCCRSPAIHTQHGTGCSSHVDMTIFAKKTLSTHSLALIASGMVCAELFPVSSLGCKLCFFHRAALEEQLLCKLLSCPHPPEHLEQLWDTGACFKLRRRGESLKMYSHMENSIDGFSFVFPLVYMIL